MALPVDASVTIRELSQQVKFNIVDPNYLSEVITTVMFADKDFREIIIRSYNKYQIKTI